MSNFLKRRAPASPQQNATRARSSVHAQSSTARAFSPHAQHTIEQRDPYHLARVESTERHEHVERYAHAEHATSMSSMRHAQTHLLSGMKGMMGGAVEVTMSRSSVVYDGERTYVEAEEQHLRGGRWEQQRMEGVWEGDQSREAIQRLSRQGRARHTLETRPLPRAKKR